MKKPPMPSTPDWDVRKVIEWTTRYFTTHRIDSPRTDAEILLAHTLDCRRIDLYLNYDQPLSVDELSVYRSYLRRRRQREPVAYIVGRKEFWSLDFIVTPQVLIPRPDTECLVETALAELPAVDDGRAKRVLELGTGSGAIVTALAKERPLQRFYASDRHPAVVALARENARRNNLDGNIFFFCADWLAGVGTAGGGFDLIVSNPPYIPTVDIAGLPPEIAAFEPRSALDGGDDGLAALGHIVDRAYAHLRSGGKLLLEIGHTQREAVTALAAATGCYGDVACHRDYGGRDRVMAMTVKK